MTQQFKPFQRVLVRDDDDQLWRACLFSHMETQDEHPYKAILSSWRQCISYEGNEHLLGTADSPTSQEPEFEFGDKVKVSRDGTFWLKAIYCRKSYDPTKPHSVMLETSTEVMLWEHCRKAYW